MHLKRKKYEAEFKYGWESLFIEHKNLIKNANYVDIVGHSWFFKKEWITQLIKELPDIDEEMFVCGEDMHLSYVLQKYLYIPTMVPPHPLENKELWGHYQKSQNIMVMLIQHTLNLVAMVDFKKLYQSI